MDAVACQVSDSYCYIDKAFLINGVSNGNICNKEIDCYHLLLDEICNVCLNCLI